jgi:hypothetical protein
LLDKAETDFDSHKSRAKKYVLDTADILLGDTVVTQFLYPKEFSSTKIVVSLLECKRVQCSDVSGLADS